MGLFSSVLDFGKSLIAPVVGGAFGLAGAKVSQDSAEDAAAANAQVQREFAQQGIQWRVEDARKAGIHPLYALGSGGASASPVAVGDTAMGSAIADFGQNVGRAIDATRSAPARDSSRLSDLQLERAALENQLLRAQITQVHRASNPPLPSAAAPSVLSGQGDSGYVVSPVDIPATTGRGAAEAGAVPSVTWQRTDSGGLVPVMSRSSGSNSGDILEPQTIDWWWRNRLSSWYSGIRPPSTSDVLPPPHLLRVGRPSDYEWKWNPWHQEFRPVVRERR